MLTISHRLSLQPPMLAVSKMANGTHLRVAYITDQMAKDGVMARIVQLMAKCWHGTTGIVIHLFHQSPILPRPLLPLPLPWYWDALAYLLRSQSSHSLFEWCTVHL